MTLRTIVPSLALMAAAVPFAQGLEFEQDDVKFEFGVRIQSRVEIAQAKDADDNDYDIWEENSYTGDDDPQTVNFMFRRVRLYHEGTYGDFVHWNVDLDFDKVGATDDTDGPAADLNGLGIGFDVAESEGMSHSISFLWDNIGVIMGVDDSSSKLLFPTGRLTGEIGGGLSEDMIFVRYELEAPLFGLTLDVAPFDAGEDGEGEYQNNNWVIGARVATPLSEEYALGKGRRESFVAGVEGFGHELGVGLAFESWDGDDEGGPSNNAVGFGIDYLFHLDQLTGQVDFAYRSEDDASKEDGEDKVSMIFNVQGGYAIPLENDLVVEPALRFAYVDQDVEYDDEMGVYNEEGGDSGVYFDLGVNLYTHGHNSKFQFNMAFYSPEEGDGDATIFRAQHALNF